MTEQLSIFASGIICGHCLNDPGRRAANAAHWNGFYDADTKQRVCMNCRTHHYNLKSKSELAGLYSEVPIVVETTLLTDKIKIGEKKKHKA